LIKQAERDRRVNDLYRKNPQLKELDEALMAAGKDGVLQVWSGGDVEAARQKITLLEEDRQRVMASLGIGEEAYEADWDCPLCQDRGYINPGEPCSCRVQDEGLRRQADSGLSSLQKKQTFENFSLEWYSKPADVARLTDQIKLFATELISGAPCGNLFLIGPVGNGKTHLCSAVANRVLAAGKTVAYYRTEELLEDLREDMYGHFGGADRSEDEESQSAALNGKSQSSLRGQLQRRLMQADLLILDDLGTERLTEFAEEQLISLIDRRINWQKPWIITSQLAGEKFTKRYDPRFVDRVLGEGKRLYLNEESIRLKKAQKGR
jgi:DNA replication protein DnaC